MFGEESKTTDRVMNVGVGAASPLWASFIMAAMAGAAYWGWTRWFKTDLPVKANGAGEPADLAAPPAPTEGTPVAERELATPAPEPEPEPVKVEAATEAEPQAPAEPVAAVVAEPVAPGLDESLAIQAAAIEGMKPVKAPKKAARSAAPRAAASQAAPAPKATAPLPIPAKATSKGSAKSAKAEAPKPAKSAAPTAAKAVEPAATPKPAKAGGKGGKKKGG